MWTTVVTFEQLNFGFALHWCFLTSNTLCSIHLTLQILYLYVCICVCICVCVFACVYLCSCAHVCVEMMCEFHFTIQIAIDAHCMSLTTKAICSEVNRRNTKLMILKFHLQLEHFYFGWLFWKVSPNVTKKSELLKILREIIHH